MTEIFSETGRSTKLDERIRKLRPRPEDSVVAVEAPGNGEGFWIGAPSAVYHDGYVYLAYRLRHPIILGRGQGVVLARSKDGVHFEQLQSIGKDEMDAESLERPTLIRTDEGVWRLYLSCATTGTKHWRVEVLEAKDPSKFDPKQRKVVLPGDTEWGVKDPVIVVRDGVWHLWATFHPLDIAGQEDRMVSNYATSRDGLDWRWHGTALAGREGHWDSRGARITAVEFVDDGVIAFYDGRATAEENYEERTGVAVGKDPGLLAAAGNDPIAQSADGRGLRYLSMADMPNDHKRLYYELTRPDGAHELRTQLI